MPEVRPIYGEDAPHVSGFDLLRLRPGRRSAAQLAALDWSEDVGEDAAKMCLFGPSPLDIVE